MPSIKSFLLLLRWSGFSQVFNILSNTVRTNYLNRKFFRLRRSESYIEKQSPGVLLEARTESSGVRINFSNADLFIDFLDDDVLYFHWEPGKPSPDYALEKKEWQGGKFRLEITVDKRVLIRGDLLSLEIYSNGEIKFYSQHGELLRHELVPSYEGAKYNPAWDLRSSLLGDEGIFGLGEQTEGLDLKSSKHILWNNDPGGSYAPGYDPIYMPMPLYLNLSPRGCYLVYYNNPHAAMISFGGESLSNDTETRANEIHLHFEGGMPRYYFFLGKPKHVLSRFIELTGRPSMPPEWALGYHQSRWGYRTQSEIEQLVSDFQEKDFPLSAIHLDIDYMRGYRVFTVDETRFPGLKELSRKLEEKDIHLVSILDPGVKCDPEYKVFWEGQQSRVFCALPDGKESKGVVWPGVSVFPDFTNPETRKWWGEYYSILLEYGISGFWHDMNEPTSFSAFGQNTLPLMTRHHLEGLEGDHLEAHNLYALLMNKAGHDALRDAVPERRPWVLSRSGWVSQQRYAWKWTGDSDSTWESLHATLTNVLGIGMSGIPFSGPDIGGFSGDPSPELYLRWLQMAAFLPFFRTHSAIGTKRREPWVYGEPYTNIIRRFIKLRYALIPYLYTLAWEAYEKGWPLVRPMFWHEPIKPELWAIDDQFLLGDNILVAPIVTSDCDNRSVYFPPGVWYSLWDNNPHQGPGEVNLPVDLETIPVFIREGTILPLKQGAKLTLRFFPSEDGNTGENQLYIDEGDGYGDFILSTFMVSRKSNRHIINWKRTGHFPFPYPLVELDLKVFFPLSLVIEGYTQSADNYRLLLKPFETLVIKVD